MSSFISLKIAKPEVIKEILNLLIKKSTTKVDILEAVVWRCSVNFTKFIINDLTTLVNHYLEKGFFFQTKNSRRLTFFMKE